MAETARDLITNSLLDLGVIADGETPSDSMIVGGLRKLNNMLDAWNIEKLMVYGSTGNVFPLFPGQSVYTMGTGGNFNIPRPNSITGAYLRNTQNVPSNQFDFPLFIYNDQEWAAVGIKQLSGSLPLGIWVDQSYPLLNVYVTPVPSDSTYSIVLWTAGILSNLTADQLISLPPGYLRALEANLCIELSQGYPASELAATTIQIARSSKDDLMAQNLQINTLGIDPRLTDPYFNTAWRLYV